MTDPRKVFLDVQGFAGFCEANVVEAVQWLTMQKLGYPRAQDFEPSGHSTSDPTGIAGTLDDDAVALGKEIQRRTLRAYKDMRWLADEFRKLMAAERPKFDPNDPNEYCRAHLQIDEYVYRYRGDLCRTCYERVLALRSRGELEDVTIEDLRHHQQRGRWPTKAVDPKSPPNMFQKRYIATQKALLDGAATLEAQEHTA